MDSNFYYVICSVNDTNLIAIANMCLARAQLRYSILTVENNLQQIIGLMGANFAQVYPTIIIQNPLFSSNQQINGYYNCISYLRGIQYKNNL